MTESRKTLPDKCLSPDEEIFPGSEQMEKGICAWHGKAYLMSSKTKVQGDFCYIVNNPTDWSFAYNIMTFGDQSKPPVQFLDQMTNDTFLKINLSISLKDNEEESVHCRPFFR